MDIQKKLYDKGKGLSIIFSYVFKNKIENPIGITLKS